MPPLEMSSHKTTSSRPYPVKASSTISNDHFRRYTPNSQMAMVFTSPRTFSPPWSTTRTSYFYFGAPKAIPLPLPEPPKRSVSFLPHVKVHYIIHIRDFSKDEVKDSYYSKNEIRAMKHQCKHDAATVTVSDYEKEQMSMYDPSPFSDSANNNSYGQHCMEEPLQLTSTVRGLENKTSMGSLRKKRHRMQAWMAVFGEQQRQQEQGYSDPDTLADAYYEVSEPCHVAANMVALRDARDVQSMDMWETKVELEKENRQGIFTSNEGSGDKLEVFGQRRYQRLVLQDRGQSTPMIVTMTA